MTDGTVDYNASHYRISVYHDLAKVAVNRLAFSGFKDLDGSQPDIWRFLEEIRERGLDAGPNEYR